MMMMLSYHRIFIRIYFLKHLLYTFMKLNVFFSMLWRILYISKKMELLHGFFLIQLYIYFCIFFKVYFHSMFICFKCFQCRYTFQEQMRGFSEKIDWLPVECLFVCLWIIIIILIGYEQLQHEPIGHNNDFKLISWDTC